MANCVHVAPRMQRATPKPHYSTFFGDWYKWPTVLTARLAAQRIVHTAPPQLMPQGWTPANRGRKL